MQSQPSQLIFVPHHLLTDLLQDHLISAPLLLAPIQALDESVDDTEQPSLKLNQLQGKALYFFGDLLGVSKYMYGIRLQLRGQGIESINKQTLHPVSKAIYQNNSNKKLTVNN